MFLSSSRSPHIAGHRFAQGLSLAAVLLCLAHPLTAAAAVAPAAECGWDRSEAAPLKGELASALDRFTDMAAATRVRLKERMARNDYDDSVVITRDSIEGHGRYDATIRDMQFGAGGNCKSVSRENWPLDRKERGLVYCEGTQCLLVPTGGGSIARISRHAVGAADATANREPDASPTDELVFEAPSAGPNAGAATADGGGSGGGAFAPGGFGAPVAAGGGGGGGPLVIQPSTPNPQGQTPTASTPQTGQAPNPQGGQPSGSTSQPGQTTPPGTATHPTIPERAPSQPDVTAVPTVPHTPVITMPTTPVLTLPDAPIDHITPSLPGTGMPVSVSPVPEPGTWALMALGLGGILLMKHRKRAA